jgi:CHAT domain-containing protein
VFLGLAAPIDSTVRVYQSHMSSLAAANRFPTRAEGDEYRKLAGTISAAVWAPVAGKLGGKRTVCLSPDGSLCQLAFGTLLDGAGRYLAESFVFDYLDAARDLVKESPGRGLGRGLLAMGDPDFDRVPDGPLLAVASPSGDSRPTAGVRATCASLTGEKVSPLPPTKLEVEAAGQSWMAQHDSAAVVLTGEAATEEAFKREAPGKRALHLATHGFALTDRCLAAHGELDPVSRRVFVQENPLLMSGLLLAGANNDPATSDSLGSEDGILSAFEIAGMDLESVELAVLSACETGLGVQTSAEGLYGVRRAFQMAGVQSVVAALWPVPDQATADLLASLYESEASGAPESVSRRLRASQLKELARLRTAGLSDHPFTWGAFVVSGRP